MIYLFIQMDLIKNFIQIPLLQITTPYASNVILSYMDSIDNIIINHRRQENKVINYNIKEPLVWQLIDTDAWNGTFIPIKIGKSEVRIHFHQIGFYNVFMEKD